MPRPADATTLAGCDMIPVHRRFGSGLLRAKARGVHAAPPARTITTAAVIIITAILILQWGIWYFAGLILLYVALDIAQRIEDRRAARTMMAILRTAGRKAESVLFVGQTRHCERAAWIARELGWLVQPMMRDGFWRRSVCLLPVGSAAPLSTLLQALQRGGLVTNIAIPDHLPRMGGARAAYPATRGWDG